jgi:hypothetical protein
MKRLASFMCGAVAVVVIAGCPASLSNPEDFIDGGTVEKDAETILAESCGTLGCHDATPLAQAGLDLVSPGVEARVVGVNVVAPMCANRILVIAGDPDASYLLDKVLPAGGICGTPMPVGSNLDADEIEVLRQWIIDLGEPGDGAPDGG